MWAGTFVLLYQWARTGSVLRIFVPYGRMSLTCYVTQAVIGVPFYYGFGLGMYRYVGPFYSLFFAVGAFALGRGAGHERRAVQSVRLLGVEQSLKFQQTDATLVIDLPRRPPTRHASAFKISFGA